MVSRVAIGYYSLPLYFLFWIADLIYVPHLKWPFLAIRALILPLSYVCIKVIDDAKTERGVQWASSLISIGNALPIVFMIYLIGDANSPYFVGLLMVATGMGDFFPWTVGFFFLQMALIFLPYYCVYLFISSSGDLNLLLVNSFFIAGICVIVAVIRIFNEQLSRKEFRSRLMRERELKSRNRTIKRKTNEGVRLERLSQQFSPQVVNRIKQGVLDIDHAPQKADICALVVDICGYTRACRRLSPSAVHQVLNLFYRTCIQRFFKYDITFDKTIGDAVLGFSNEPRKYADYVPRVVQAALEIQGAIELEKTKFDKLWKDSFKVKIGVAEGEAEVGFFGDENSPKNYTASGEVMNLTARLCSSARPDEVLVTADVAGSLKTNKGLYWDKFSFADRGVHKLAGYEDKPLRLYSVSKQYSASDIDIPECPTGHGQLHLEEENGIFVFKCRECDFILDENSADKNDKKKAA